MRLWCMARWLLTGTEIERLDFRVAVILHFTPTTTTSSTTPPTSTTFMDADTHAAFEAVYHSSAGINPLIGSPTAPSSDDQYAHSQYGLAQRVFIRRHHRALAANEQDSENQNDLEKDIEYKHDLENTHDLENKHDSESDLENHNDSDHASVHRGSTPLGAFDAGIDSEDEIPPAESLISGCLGIIYPTPAAPSFDSPTCGVDDSGSGTVVDNDKPLPSLLAYTRASFIYENNQYSRSIK
ncbi:hypothetical protein MIND_01146200 [Mycena indigotica]|uniref:Uncharacterized protein n=1 Tax=Mycena indigotica TaxID=2126181 RepID=A0A8H6S770_9AGAR|nr:uncharacterized protein MIND_01146200 [Mycena indigotica]KAF7293662.1 hypothetical protein MIND_01146200 [Mycena indigotica]